VSTTLTGVTNRDTASRPGLTDLGDWQEKCELSQITLRKSLCLIRRQFHNYGHVFCHDSVRDSRSLSDVGAPLGNRLKSRQSVIIVVHPLTPTLSPEAIGVNFVDDIT